MRVGPAAACVLAAAALSACGGDDGGRRAGATPAAAGTPVGPSSGGSVVQYADCGDWRAGTAADRRATVRELRRQLTPQTSRSARSPLPDARAYRILEQACTPAFADSLRLYKLYVRAQAFAPLGD